MKLGKLERQKLWRAGDREWGQKMQDDNDDGVKWLIDQHVPTRAAAVRSGASARSCTRSTPSSRSAAEPSQFIDAHRLLDTVQAHPRIGMLAPWLFAPLTPMIDG